MAEKEYIERDTCRDVLMRFLNSPCIQCGDYPSIMSVETCIKLFDSVPAADVVPRLEWLNDCEQLCCPAIAERDAARVERELLQEELDALISNYTECMKNYAREIFTEIERIHEECIYIDPTTNIGSLKVLKFERMLAELKKKYTEE